MYSMSADDERVLALAELLRSFDDETLISIMVWLMREEEDSENNQASSVPAGATGGPGRKQRR